MSVSSESPSFNLSRPATPEALAGLRSGVEAAVCAGATSVVVDVDDLGVLDAPVISALLALQRSVRTADANVALRAGRAGILDTLRITALDKVFTVVTSGSAGPAPAAKPPKASRLAKRYVAALLAGALLAFGGSRAQASASGDPHALIADVIAQDAIVASYRAHVSVDFKLRSFPYISQHLDGTTYYKRPDNFEVVFENVPSYAKGFDKLYSDIDDPSSWERRFEMSLVGRRKVSGHDDVVVRLVQRVRGMIDHEDVAIDPERAHIDSMQWFYYNGGTISMTQSFEKVGGFDVLASQHATIHIPFVHAAADAAYTGYETGVPIDDAVFTRGSHK